MKMETTIFGIEHGVYGELIITYTISFLAEHERLQASNWHGRGALHSHQRGPNQNLEGKAMA